MPALIHLTTDPVLHTYRLRIVSPSRVNHKLFGVSPQGHTLRPTLVDLVHRGVIKGLGIERRWRMGGYFYSLNVRCCFLSEFSDTHTYNFKKKSLSFNTRTCVHFLADTPLMSLLFNFADERSTAQQAILYRFFAQLTSFPTWNRLL